MQKSRVRRIGALLAGLAIVAASCGDDKKDSSSDTTAAPTTVVSDTTAAVETTVADTVGDTTPVAGGNELAGMKGTTPLVELSQDFKDRLATTASGAALKDYNYAGETYDAIVTIARAAVEAKTDGSAMADHIVGITKDGEKCTDFAACVKIIDAGGDPD